MAQQNTWRHLAVALGTRLIQAADTERRRVELRKHGANFDLCCRVVLEFSK